MTWSLHFSRIAFGLAWWPVVVMGSIAALDRARGDRLPLEWIVHRQTQANAKFFDLNDRGALAPGMKADVNVIDFDGLQLRPPHIVRDLPAGGRRLIQEAQGYIATVQTGAVTFEHGEHSGALPGGVIRGQQKGPTAA